MLLFLNQPKEENDPRNYFMINLHDSMERAEIDLSTPGYAVGLATDCATGPVQRALAVLGFKYRNSKTCLNQPLKN